MRNTIVLGVTFLLFSSFIANQESQVFICKSVSSKRYHLKKTCRGLNRCKSQIKKIPRSVAKNYGRTLCKWED